MNLEELKTHLKKIIPEGYIYISHSLHGPKSVTTYNIYYNSRLQGVRISQSAINNQTVHRNLILQNNNLSYPSFSNPILIDEYSRPLRTNSIINLIDLSGIYLSNY